MDPSILDAPEFRELCRPIIGARLCVEYVSEQGSRCRSAACSRARHGQWRTPAKIDLDPIVLELGLRKRVMLGEHYLLHGRGDLTLAHQLSVTHQSHTPAKRSRSFNQLWSVPRDAAT